MANVVILWATDESGLNFDYVELDASLSESHRGQADVTSNPIETGVEAADHIISRPDELQLEGVISNTPAILLAALRVDSDRAEQAYEKLVVVKDQGLLVTIFTTLRLYEDMALINLEVPRTAATGNMVLLRLGFRAVQVVESQVVDAPEPAMARASPRKAEGRKAAKPTESIASQLATAIGAL